MKIEDTESYLNSIILKGTSLREAFDKFLDFFFQTPVEKLNREDDEDMLLFEAGGPYSWSDFYAVSLTRQFMINDEDGEYERMQQLRMEFLYDLDSVPERPETNAWNSFEEKNEFVNQIEDTGILKIVENINPAGFSISLNDV